MSNTEYRAVIKFFTRKELSATEITEQSANVYSHSARSCGTIAKWIVEFTDLTGPFEDAPRSDQPTTPAIDEGIRTIEEVMTRDRQISVQRAADELTI